MAENDRRVGWFIRMLRGRALRRMVSLLILLFIGFCIWAIAFPHESSTSGPVSLDDATGCPIPLPDSARNIQYFTRFHWQAFSDFVKFEAPVKDCLDHVDVVIADWQEDYDGRSLGRPLSPIAEPIQPIHFVVDEHGLDWFDPHTIKEGESAGAGGSCRPRIWVDTQRGIFYYMMTD